MPTLATLSICLQRLVCGTHTSIMSCDHVLILSCPALPRPTLPHLPQVTSRATLHCTNCYDIPNVECVGRICRTNLPSNTAFRGFGGPQGMMAMEQIIDHVASTLDMEPYKVRSVCSVCVCVRERVQASYTLRCER